MEDKLIDKAEELSEYLSDVSPQINNKGELQWYLNGSLATMTLANAKRIQMCTVKNGNIKEENDTKDVSEEARDNLKYFSRKIHDIDVINVLGNVWKKETSYKGIQRIVSNTEELFNGELGHTSLYDQLEQDRKIDVHRVSKVETKNGKNIYMASPEAQIAHKLEELIYFSAKIEFKEGEKNDQYYKDIKDFTVITNGLLKIYDKEELEKEVAETINEKNNSHLIALMRYMPRILKNVEKDINTFVNDNDLIDKISSNEVIDFLENIHKTNRIIKFRQTLDKLDLSNEKIENKIANKIEKISEDLGLDMKEEINNSKERTKKNNEKEYDKITFFHDQKSEQYFEDMKTGKYNIPTSKIGKATINTPAKAKQEAERIEEKEKEAILWKKEYNIY